LKFEDAVEIVLVIEGNGKIANHSSDPGGLTKWGISFRAFPELGLEGIRNLTKEEAINLYRQHYWLPTCEAIPELLRLAVFDASVHHGPTQSIKLLQRGLNSLGARLKLDGVVGPLTTRSLADSDLKQVLVQMLRERQKFVRRLEEYSVFSGGWESRILTVAIESAI
jgi:lysozyme family protein